MNEQDDDKFVEDLSRRLRTDEVDVSPEVAARLQAARRQAVEIADQPTPAVSPWPRVAGVSGALAAALLVAVVVRTPTDTLPRMPAEELAAAQEAELLEELEFVAWMVAMDEADDLPNQG